MTSTPPQTKTLPNKRLTIFHLYVSFILFVTILALKNEYRYMAAAPVSPCQDVDLLRNLSIDSFAARVRENTLPSNKTCSLKDRFRERPEDVTKRDYDNVRVAEEIVKFIVEELHKVGAPVALLYGTALHEYRDGTGNCVQPSFKEDDFDLGVFREHFHYVVLLIDEIKTKFGWYCNNYLASMENKIVYFGPWGRVKARGGFQVDVYSFEVQPDKEFVWFNWDERRMALNSFLPLVKHKPSTDASVGGSVPHYYMPFDAPCYLENLYGADYMTPKKKFKADDVNTTAKVHQNDEKVHQEDKFGHPHCNRTMSAHDLRELERQMSFVNVMYPFKSTAEAVWKNLRGEKSALVRARRKKYLKI